MHNELVLLSGSSHRKLAEEIADQLDVSLCEALIGEFSDGETRVRLDCNVRGRDVFVIQPTSAPTNHHIMEALIIGDACRRASAGRITLVAPYYGYARQERKEQSRTAISAKLVADMIELRYDRVLGIELHAGAIQGFFNIPFDHLYGRKMFADKLKGKGFEVIVSPDAGGVQRVRALAKDLGCEIAIIDKRRPEANVSEVMHVVGDVDGKTCLIYDDMCDTGGSLCKAADAIKQAGASLVSGAVVHPVMSGPAYSRIEESCLEKFYVTNTIPLIEKSSKIEVLGKETSTYLSKAIRRIHNNESVSSLF